MSNRPVSIVGYWASQEQYSMQEHNFFGFANKFASKTENFNLNLGSKAV
jgi:hypothetical protein